MQGSRLFRPTALLATALALVCPPLAAQQVRWARHFGGSGSDGFEDVIALPSGGFVACGSRWLPAPSWIDAYVVQVDANGIEQWSETFGGDGEDYATSIVRTADGGLAVAGRTQDGGSFVGFLRKLDANGGLLWEQRYELIGVDERIHDVIETSDGGFLLSGQTRFPHGPFLNYDFWVVRTNASGEALWQQGYGFGPGGNDVAHTAVQLDDGSFVVAGSAQDYWGPWVIGLSASGALEWSRNYSTTSGGGFDEAVVTADGNLAFIGEAVQSVGDVNIVLTRTDADGVLLDEDFYDLGGTSSSSDSGTALVERADGGFAISAYSSSNNGGYDVFVMRTDAQGGELWSTFLGGASDDRGFALAAALDGSLVVAAWDTWSNGQDAWLVRVEDSACAGTIDSYCAVAPHSGGQVVLMGATGSASLQANDLILTASGGRAGAACLFVYGTAATQLPFGDGYRCVAGTVFRLPPIQSFTPSGTAQRTLDFGVPPFASGPGMLRAGESAYFQLWYRDSASTGAGFNLSNGLHVVVCP
jgi:hypothetical protein